MENSTKALLIAAAILIAILIISLGLVVYNMAAEQVSNANLSEIEMKSFNSKFENYDGVNRTKDDINALLKTVFSSNQAEIKSGRNLLVQVVFYETSSKSYEVLSTAANTWIKTTINGRWEISCQYKDGLVTSIITKVTPTT